MPKLSTLLFSVLLTVLFVVPHLAQACSCEPPPAALTALEQSAVVFSGSVTAIEEGETEWLGSVFFVRFSVERSWKAATADDITVTTASDDARCGYHFELGEKYLIYGTAPVPGDEHYSVTICSRTRGVAAADDDLRALGRPTAVDRTSWARLKNLIFGKLDFDGSRHAVV